MTKYFSLAFNTGSPSSNTKAVAARRPSRSEPRIKHSGIWLTGLLFVMAVAYLLQTNSVSTKGYEIDKLEGRLMTLQEQNERLEIEARTLTAIETIESETRSLNYIPAADASHLRFDGNFSYQR